MATCSYVPGVGGSVSALIDFFDCQARTLGAAGFQALAAPGSSASLLLTALLTILVAFFGFRLLLDDTPAPRELVLTFVKIGAVLAFASSWSAYRTVVYDVVIEGPGQLAAEVTGSLDLPGSDGTLARRLDNIDREFATLEAFGTGHFVADALGSEPSALAANGFDRLALTLSRTFFLLTSIGAIALLRLSAGLLLALGPLFVGFLLFVTTRGLFEGWLRALIFIVLGGVATVIMLSVELSVLEPWMADLVGRRAAGESIVTATTPLLAAVAVFGIVSTALLMLCMRVGFSLRLPAYRQARTVDARQPSPASRDLQMMSTAQVAGPAAIGRSRANLIVDSVAAAQQREEHMLQASSLGAFNALPSATSAGSDIARVGMAPLGRSFRRTSRRVSSSVRARDRR